MPSDANATEGQTGKRLNVLPFVRRFSFWIVFFGVPAKEEERKLLCFPFFPFFLFFLFPPPTLFTTLILEGGLLFFFSRGRSDQKLTKACFCFTVYSYFTFRL